MNVAIITFHNSTNYGAVLQAFALQKKIFDLQNNVEIIDYVCQHKKNMYKIAEFKKNASLKYNLLQIINAPLVLSKNRKMYKFMNKNYKLTLKKFYSSKEVRKYLKQWDKVICGSDQIWNYNNTGFDKTYFLDFIDDEDKKISYAASFGVENIENKYIEEYKKLLSGIKYLSVREESGKKIIKKILNRDVKVVLDPTLLLGKNEWCEFSSVKYMKKDKYILLYTLHYSSEIIDIAKKLSEKLKYKVIMISTRMKYYFSSFKCLNPNPNEFVNLINNAEYVITDSFHGTVFSINLEKEFFVYLNDKLKNNSRVENILSVFGLENRILKNNNDFKIQKKINYQNISYILSKLRNDSIEFLVNSLGEDKNGN